MKVPFPANNQIKPIPANNNTATPPNTTVFPPANTSPYEPKSVLDLQGSPSPITDQKPDPSIITTLAADDHVLINSQLDDFDSLMRDWGLHDDDDDDPTKPFSQLNDSDGSAETLITDIHNNNNNNNYSSFEPPSQQHQFVTSDNYNLLPEIPIYTTNPNFTNPIENISGDPSWSSTVGLDYVDELIRLAQCIETNSVQLGHGILARLNQRLRSPAGKPLQRAAFYFKEALQSLMLTGSGRPAGHNPANTFQIVQVIKAQKAFSSVSPIPMFAGFTANQAVLEALLDGGGSMHVHVIDFDIGLGGHWASFMKELADRSCSRQAAPPPSLRVSAVVPERYAAESGLIRENLALFARELNIRFDIEFVLIRTFEYLSFKAFKYMDGERVAVILTPAIFRHVGAAGFLSGLRRVSPHVVVHVDAEGMVGLGTTSFRQAVIDGLEFYSTLLESLEAANFNGGGGGVDWMRRIETFVVYPKIAEAVEGAGGRQGTGLSEALAAAGLRQVGLSQFAEFQADCLLRRVQISGFHVAKRQAEMLLCWHDRPLVATSAWRY
ncbi:scarecrow-like protein 15 [Phtheirospermum japonicum]|uniref:Scarecrow-like protein 15 n=1 Tax=Phtheirospermum japonicum TaxID=374723 RepID=A0A830DFC3_9LAMI|nr:scarecrow-like protein 15 [Phtheirospermum japonicum]